MVAKNTPRKRVPVKPARAANTNTVPTVDVDPDVIAGDNYAFAGILTRDPELRFTPAGKAVCNLRLAFNVREKDGERWFTSGVMYFDVTVWGDMAVNVSQSVGKADSVVGFGQWESETYKSDEGEEREVIKVTARNIGPSLMWRVAEPKQPE